ncbi:D-glycero-beta-D-manno-heptose-7-phosphate kinase [Lichenicoccus sp.]|uniref:D-glycero-beta-D-manno-heptose-7-phosphate kinase n=1 Tax=Lichenicoccus sp. TaxID=2781899 RepID=UPI003D117528
MDFGAICVLCVGDVMLDRYVYGEMERISPEAPVPVLRLTRTREMAGGVGNVASNILSLGGRAVLVGLIGRDAAGARLRQILVGQGRVLDALVESEARPTICKTRYIAAHQQVVRADEESRLALQPAEALALKAAIDSHIGQAQVLLLSDYGKGVCAPALVAHAIAQARRRRIPVFVDPKSNDFSRYRGADCITPNARELSAAAGLPVEDALQVEAAARAVMAHAEAGAILATRSDKGMILVERDGPALSVPARAREVFDVSGAGDTVIAAMALARGAGQTLAQAMRIANAAAGVVVGKLGTATADIAEVMQELLLLDQQFGEHAAETALSTLSHAKAQVARWKAQGLRVGFTNGCFDIIHPGHVALLGTARAECDRLIVALNADASVSRLKGPTRPVNRLAARAQVMAAIRHVDGVVSFDEDTPLALIQALSPDVLVKGGDYTLETTVGADFVQANGGRVVLTGLVPEQSTTATLERIRAGYPRYTARSP